MNNRTQILENLRAAQQPFTNITSSPENYLPMVPNMEPSADDLRARFVAEAEKLACIVHQPADHEIALETVLALVKNQAHILSWNLDHIPIPNLAQGLESIGVSLAKIDDPDVQIGLSGADGALAATGSLVLKSGVGQARAASLLPPVHIAVIEAGQVVADLENWIAQQRSLSIEKFREISNITLVSGASRTADIAMQLVMGMHGPGTLHIVIVPG